MGRVLLVRHGQASFGADDYDVLSDLGHEQAAAVGRSLRERGVAVPDLVLAGGLRRQQDTAAALVAAAGWSAPVETDPRWDEFDHLGVVAAHGQGDMRTMDRRTFQAAFETATIRWVSGADPLPGTADTGEVETWAAFSTRVGHALRAATATAGPGATVLVASSGGPIAAAAAQLLGLEAEVPAAWSRLNTVLVNTGVTTVVVGATGPRLLTYNDHHHLTSDQLTYR